MPTQQEDLAVQFLLDVLPMSLLTAYRTVAMLRYPIADKHSLTSQLDGHINKDKDTDKANQVSIELVRASFEPVDFPIETPRSGLEKFHARILQLGYVEAPDRDSIDRPDICEVYENTFGRICGQEACDAYHQAINAGIGEVRAPGVGLAAGQECQRRLAEALQSFLRRRREPRPRPRF